MEFLLILWGDKRIVKQSGDRGSWNDTQGEAASILDIDELNSGG